MITARPLSRLCTNVLRGPSTSSCEGTFDRSVFLAGEFAMIDSPPMASPLEMGTLSRRPEAWQGWTGWLPGRDRRRCVLTTHRASPSPMFTIRTLVRLVRNGAEVRSMLGGMISDLEAGDEFEPIRYTVTSMMTAEYAHGVEETGEWFLSDDNE